MPHSTASPTTPRRTAGIGTAPGRLAGRAPWTAVAGPEVDLAAHAAEIPVAPERMRVHLLPAGQFAGRDGRGPYHVPDPAALDAALTRHGMALPIEYEHPAEDAYLSGQPVPAAGWIVGLEHDADGTWGLVEWTERARALIAAHEYRYLSPVYYHDRPAPGVPALAVRALSGAGLTNRPNLHLRALARAQHSETMMDDLLERICYALQLPLTSTPDEVLAHIQRVITAARTAETATTAAQSAEARAASLETELATARAQLAEQAQQVRAQQATETVAAAMRERRVSPAQREWAEGYALADPAGFQRYLQSAQTILPGAGGTTTPAAVGSDYESLVQAAQTEHQITRGQALMRVAREHPEAHRAWVESTQPGAAAA